MWVPQADEQGGHEGRPEDESDEEDDVGVPLVDALADGEVGQEARPFVATEPADELRYKQLVLLLADEVAAVEQEFEYEEKLNEEKRPSSATRVWLRRAKSGGCCCGGKSRWTAPSTGKSSCCWFCVRVGQALLPVLVSTPQGAWRQARVPVPPHLPVQKRA